MPDSVIDAMAAYLRESNANLGGAFETSRRSDALVVDAPHDAAARFLGCDAGRGRLRPEHDDAQLRAHAHARPRAPRRRRDPRHAARPRRQRLALARARRATSTSSCASSTSHEDDARSTWTTSSGSSSDRTRVVAFPLASNAVGTITDAGRIVDARARRRRARLGRRRPLRAARPDRRRASSAPTCSLCSPYKFFGPHLGLFYGRRELLERWRPYKVRPAPDEPLGAPLRDRARSRTSCSPASTPRSSTSSRSAGTGIVAHERELGERFLAGLPDAISLHGPPTMDGRVATFAVTVPGLDARAGRDAPRRARISRSGGATTTRSR